MVLVNRALGIMIELCSKKCMAFLIILLLIVTVLALVLENELSSSHTFHGLSFIAAEDNATKQCWLHEEFEIKKDCTYCTDFEKKSNTRYCAETGFKMMVKCEKSGSKWKSCQRPKNPYVESRRFWIFESSSLVVGLVTYAIVYVRRKNLDKSLMEKINRQIASGV